MSTTTPEGVAPAAPSEDTEARLFSRLRKQIIAANLRELMAHARLRTLLVAGLSAFFWGGLFLLFHWGFSFISQHVGAPGASYHSQTVQFIFDLFFASLNVMLVFSSGIILYSGLFSSREARFLLTTPARAERIVLHKFEEAVLFSSWGFFLLASPMTIAYGLVSGAGWQYYALIMPLVLSFVYIPCGVGALICLFLVYMMPAMRQAVAAVVALVSVAFAGRAVWLTVSGPQERLFGSEWFNETVRRFSITQEEWLPSSWLSHGLLEAVRPMTGVATEFTETPIIRSLLYLSVLVTNALLLRLAVWQAGKWWYRKAFSQLECRPRWPRRAAIAWVDRLADHALAPLPKQMRLILIKDWRLLRRDPVQWSQFLIFFGLLGLYFLNLDRFNNPKNDVSYITWVNMVSFLNLAVVGLILSTFTTRFIYPMVSLEGRRFWVLGLMPIRRETIVWSKFVFASFGSWAPCGLLILVSDAMLRVDGLIIAAHQFTTVLLCFGLAALAVGLGAMMPNFHEPSPSKIAAGFGGTLNLVLSALYIIVTIVLAALPCHIYLIVERGAFSLGFVQAEHLPYWVVGAALLAIIVGMVTTLLPLRRGVRAFRDLDFF
ncbi:hypothetical protein Mal64_04160 [Pseudobythopirellula maris]|uniref:Uncharacterized protein n=1 Tax=Pseudobythopirellula maris TaxID=2527991 RepID=A0A5C5ZUW5_9BACT|nr:hypothetical protein [Pseudobythopirellula maris]TWT90033.1 hypothetical protein Mal64_04160 [Pseudobythopirellula maris]